MSSQNNTFKISAEQSNLISKKLKEIPFDVQLGGEYLPITSSDKINILIIDSEVKDEIETEDKPTAQVKSSQNKNSAKKTQKKSTTKNSTQTSSSKSSLKSKNSKSSQKTTTKASSQNKKHEAQQNDPTEQDSSKELNDWLDNLL